MAEDAGRKRVVRDEEACSNVIESKRKQDDQQGKKPKLNDQEPPMEFRCRISGNLMKHPVIAQSGQIKDGHQILPKDSNLESVIPNELQLLRTLPKNLPYADVYEETAAIKKILSLTTNTSTILDVFGVETESINKLLNTTSIQRSYSNASMQQDLAQIVSQILLHMAHNRKIFEAADCPNVVPFLVESLAAQNSVTTRRCVAASVYQLSTTLESNKRMIGKSKGAIRHLVRLVKAETDPFTLRFANAALCNVCTLVENRQEVVSEGVVTAVLGKIVYQDRIVVDPVNLHLLAMLSSHEWRIGETEANHILHCLFAALATTISQECEDYCVDIAYRLCSDSRKIDVVQTLERIASSVRSATTRDKADKLLRMLDCCLKI